MVLQQRLMLYSTLQNHAYLNRPYIYRCVWNLVLPLVFQLQAVWGVSQSSKWYNRIYVHHEWWSAVGSIDSFYKKRLRLKTWFWRYHRWFFFGESSKSLILKRLLIFYLPNTFVHHFVYYFLSFLKQYRTSETRHIICNYFIKKIACLNVTLFQNMLQST